MLCIHDVYFHFRAGGVVKVNIVLSIDYTPVPLLQKPLKTYL